VIVGLVAAQPEDVSGLVLHRVAEAFPAGDERFVLPWLDKVHLDPDAVIHGFLDRIEEALAGKHVRELLDQVPGVPCGMPLVAALAAS
jgi:hypothetical protein